MRREAFEFNLCTEIVFGEGKTAEAGKKVRELGAGKVMIVTDPGVIRAGLVKTVEESLEKEGIPFVVFDKIVPNPRISTCEQGYTAAQEEGVDLLVAVGGGSSLDVAKAIATLMTNGGSIKDYIYPNKLKVPAAPVLAIPTTAGTGSEVTPYAVITDTDNGTKNCIFDVKCAAKVALLDPAVLLHMPAHIMAATGMDAMTHAVEAYTCTVSKPHTDAFALYAIELISKNLRRACENPDMDSCAGMMLGSNIAGIAFGYADTASVHCLAEALGGQYDVPHGIACSVFLPTVAEFNIPAAARKYAAAARALGIDTRHMTDEEAARAAVRELEKLSEDVGLPKLRDVRGVQPEDFRTIAVKASGNVSNDSNPRKASVEDYLMMLNRAYER